MQVLAGSRGEGKGQGRGTDGRTDRGWGKLLGVEDQPWAGWPGLVVLWLGADLYPRCSGIVFGMGMGLGFGSR